MFSSQAKPGRILQTPQYRYHSLAPFNVKEHGLLRFRMVSSPLFKGRQPPSEKPFRPLVPDLFFLQTSFRPEQNNVGTPFCEAVDLGAGCVMGIMMFGFELFPTTTDYDALLFIIDLLGPPPQHLMKAAQKSKVCFKKTDCGQWRLKTPEEYWGPDLSSHDDRKYTFRSLDEGKMLCLEQDNVTEADERRECMELLKETGRVG
ncbi:homeodomain-interacting protein kinase 4-like [Cottoperca gobio]|uniref:Homeodomain-interacting protein kinase 4-like n=1 Tax=Cottoperca gobio TaxID=56716 RepID=A0A6J2PEX4_COTGO|nr:homeodomain-interacting protein kinase 4-like [Cottoperca gobio]